MSCILHNIGAKVKFDIGSSIIEQSTKKVFYIDREMEGIVNHIDKENHNLTVYLPELNDTFIADAKDAKTIDEDSSGVK